MVYFVGAGCGAADLITVRGARLIAEADVIIYAGSLVNPQLLLDARPGCRIYNSAKMTLEEVIAVMEAAEEKGQTTVRLHTGDPSLYGAIREQIDILEEKGISYDICPGVSSMAGAAAALGAEYTLPGISQSVVITRAEGRTAVPERENLKSFAGHGATMVIFLSAGLAEQVQKSLLEGGYGEDVPVAVVFKATWPEERIIRTTLKNLAADMEREQIDHTALIIVGNILGAEYEKSRLYDASFTTGFREAQKCD